MSLTLALNTALSGLLTSQRGLDVISQNVVNVNTPGYTRKVMNQESRNLAGFGAGVQVGSVNRAVNQGLLKDLRRQSTDLGRLETEQTYYPRIDDLFGQVGDETSIAHRISNLQASFQNLSTAVNRPSSQWAALQSAQDVGDLMSGMTASLQNLRIEADRSIESTVTDINNLLHSIHDLNQKIVKNSAIATGTSDLEDQRDTAINQLSELIDVRYYERENGSMTIFSGSGQMLLDNQPADLSYAATSTTDSWMTAAGGQFGKITVNGGSQDLGTEVISGKLRALVDMRDHTLPNLQANLDEVTKKVTNVVNQVHNRGTSLPNVSSRYQGTRVFAKQGDIQPVAAETGATIYKGTTALGNGAYTSLAVAADTTNPWQATITATAPGTFAAGTFAVGEVFSISGSSNSRNDGTYRVLSYSATQLKVEKVNVRQTMQLQNSDDVVIATFDGSGNQLKQTTLNTIMQTDFSASYTATTTGAGRSLADFTAKGDHDQWAVNEVSAHVEGWLKSQGYANASVNLDADGKMVMDLGDSTVSLAFRDQGSSTAGAGATDAAINFDVNGDGAMDESVKGFSAFFGLNDLYVNTRPAGIQDSTILPASFSLPTNRDLTLYDTTGKIGNTFVMPKGATLQQIADTINAQTRTTESAALSNTSWTLNSDATITVSDGSGNLLSVTLTGGTGTPADNHTLAEIAGKLTQAPVSAQVVQDGNLSRLRLTDARGQELHVSFNGGAVAGSALDLGQTLDMTPTQRIQASVVPEGSGYRLRIRQTTGDTLYSSSQLDGQGKNLLSDLGLERAATGAAGSTTVRKDLMQAPEKISRSMVQWNADTGRYFISEGDNSTALALSAAMSSKVSMASAGGIYAGEYSLSDYAAATISVVTQQAGASQTDYSYQKTLNDSLNFQNSSYSGVNLDEEVAEMVNFQQAYAASAKVMSVLQDMLETLTSMIR